MMQEQFGELKFTYRHRKFWRRGDHVDTAGRNKAKTAGYIRHQPAGDKRGERLSIPYAGSPFTGRRQQKCRGQTVYACRGAAGKKALQAHKRKHRLCRWFPIFKFG